MAGFRSWTEDDRLTPDDINGYLMGQVVARFADADDRDAQIGSAVPGMVSYLVDPGILQIYSTGDAWVALGTDPALVADVLAVQDALGTKVDNTNASITGSLNMFGDLRFVAPGTVCIVEGSGDARQGTVDLVAGTVVVSTTAFTGQSRVWLTAQALGTVTVPSALAVSAHTIGESFTILASDPADTSTVGWLLTEWI